MRVALLCVLLAACSGKGQTTPTVAEAQKRMGIPCEDNAGMVSCGAVTDPLHAAIFYRSEQDVKTAKVSSVTITLEAASAEDALAKLHTLLDGLIPAGHFEGIRTRISGATAQAFDQNKPPVVIDGVEVRAGTWRTDRQQPAFQIEVWYR
jgi:hypothetical protein